MKERAAVSPSLSRWQELAFAMGRRVAPFAPRPRFFEVGTVLQTSKMAQVVIDALPVPECMPDLCLARPSVFSPDGFLSSPEILDLTSWFRDQLLPPTIESLLSPLDFPQVLDLTHWFGDQLLLPTIESLFVPLKQPLKAGKAYGEKEAEVVQAPLMPPDTDERCRHGLLRGQCAICSGWRERQKPSERKVPSVDVFDLIFPILIPPLGKHFDNASVLPPGKKLLPFQPEGVRFLADRESALLADEMGLGKTVQAITAARLLFQNGTIKNGLVLCPKSILRQWENEINEWARELQVTRISGPKEIRKVLWDSSAHLYLATYDTWREDHSDIARNAFDLCILDELQRIKNPGTQTTQAVRWAEAKFRWGLSGTPLENRVEDLISIFTYLKRGLLKYDDAQFPSRVKDRIKPYFLRRRQADVLDLPPKMLAHHWDELNPAQKEAYERAENEGIVALSEKGEYRTVQHVLALITKLKQICNIEVISGESCKLDYLIDELEKISQKGDKALVFSQYPEKTLKRIEPRLTQFKLLLYYGGLSDKERDEIISRFKTSSDHVVLLMSTKAGGLGLNLTEANHVYHFDLWWNPATRDQAGARVYRIGQDKPVFVTSLLTKDTIEERIQKILNKKDIQFKEVIDDLSVTIDLQNVLTEEDLFGLFGLKPPPRRGADSTAGAEISEANLDRLSPPEFQRLVGRLYERMGYSVQPTSLTRDEGVDLYARRVSDTGTEHLAVQCKHYPQGTVGAEVARDMLGVMHAKPYITQGVLVTSGRFSSDCERQARGNRIELVDRSLLLGLLLKYNLPIKEEHHLR